MGKEDQADDNENILTKIKEAVPEIFAVGVIVLLSAHIDTIFILNKDTISRNDQIGWWLFCCAPTTLLPQAILAVYGTIRLKDRIFGHEEDPQAKTEPELLPQDAPLGEFRVYCRSAKSEGELLKANTQRAVEITPQEPLFFRRAYIKLKGLEADLVEITLFTPENFKPDSIKWGFFPIEDTGFKMLWVGGIDFSALSGVGTATGDVYLRYKETDLYFSGERRTLHLFYEGKYIKIATLEDFAPPENEIGNLTSD